MSWAIRYASRVVLTNSPSSASFGVEFAEFLGDLAKYVGDVLVLRHIARHEQRVRPKGSGELFDVFLQPFALVGEGEFRAGFVPGLGDGPRDGPFVCDAEDDSEFSRK